MTAFLQAIARWVWPDIDNLSLADYWEGLAAALGLLYGVPLAVVGLIGLATVTDFTLMLARWPTVLTLAGLGLLLILFEFSFVAEVEPKVYMGFQGSMVHIILFSLIFLFGPAALWLPILLASIRWALDWRKHTAPAWRWDQTRIRVLEIAGITPLLLAGLTLYPRLGGQYPLPGLLAERIVPALIASWIALIAAQLVWIPHFLYLAFSGQYLKTASGRARYLAVNGAKLIWPLLVAPFGVLGAGLYGEKGIWVYLFFVSGFVLTSLLAHQLSRAIQNAQQRSREMETLGQLGRALLDAPPDNARLPDLLKTYAPNMFLLSRVDVRLFPDRIMARWPSEPSQWDGIEVGVWGWLPDHLAEAQSFPPGKRRPWGSAPAQRGTLVVPIVHPDTGAVVGSVLVSRVSQARRIANSLPAAQSLAAQVASALHSAETYRQNVDYQRAQHELALAGEIQDSFLPDNLPQIAGWHIKATLEPAHETSGDFFDGIALPGGHIGLVVADVTDKGLGAAIYMALSRTLIRTFAFQYHDPAQVFVAANARIVGDTHTNMFVTALYAVVDAASGAITYANAGHNPAYLFRANDGGQTVEALRRTGLPLGLFAEGVWEQRVVSLAPGDALVLYTDGIVEARNGRREFFGDERLVRIIRENLGRSASALHDAVIRSVRDFLGETPQNDDITLVVITRDAESVYEKGGLERREVHSLGYASRGRRSLVL